MLQITFLNFFITLGQKLSLEESFTDHPNREIFAFRGNKISRMTYFKEFAGKNFRGQQKVKTKYLVKYNLRKFVSPCSSSRSLKQQEQKSYECLLFSLLLLIFSFSFSEIFPRDLSPVLHLLVC